MAAPARAAAASLEASIQSLMPRSDKMLVQPGNHPCPSSLHPTWLVLVLVPLECHSCCLLLLQPPFAVSVLQARLRNSNPTVAHGADPGFKAEC